MNIVESKKRFVKSAMILFALIFFISLTLTKNPTNNVNTNTSFKLGINAYKQNQFAIAQTFFQQAIEKSGNLNAYKYLGLSQLKAMNSNPVLAVENIKYYLEQKEDLALRETLVNSLLYLGQDEKAYFYARNDEIMQARSLLRKSPEKALFALNMVSPNQLTKKHYELYTEIYFLLNDWDKVLKKSEMALDLGTINSKTIYQRTQALNILKLPTKRDLEIYKFLATFNNQEENLQLSNFKKILNIYPQIIKNNVFTAFFLGLVLNIEGHAKFKSILINNNITLKPEQSDMILSEISEQIKTVPDEIKSTSNKENLCDFYTERRILIESKRFCDFRIKKNSTAKEYYALYKFNELNQQKTLAEQYLLKSYQVAPWNLIIKQELINLYLIRNKLDSAKNISANHVKFHNKEFKTYLKSNGL